MLAVELEDIEGINLTDRYIDKCQICQYFSPSINCICGNPWPICQTKYLSIWNCCQIVKLSVHQTTPLVYSD